MTNLVCQRTEALRQRILPPLFGVTLFRGPNRRRIPVFEIPTLIALAIIMVVTHVHPHLDEIFAMWLMTKFGTPDWVKDHCPAGRTHLGVNYPDGRHGEFNEHGEGYENDCCATLVARSLGLMEHVWFKLGLAAVFNHDKHAKGHNELATFINTWHMIAIMTGANEDRLVIAWTFEALDAWLYGRVKRETFIRELGQLKLNARERNNRIRAWDRHGGGEFGLARLTELVREYHPAAIAAEWVATLTRIKTREQELLADARTELEQKAKTTTVTAGGRTLTVYTIESDHQLIFPASHDPHLSPPCDVLFIINGNGHCQVLHNRRANLDFTRVAVRLREYLARQMIRRGLLPKDSMPTAEQLAVPYFTPGLDRLYWQGPMGPVLNGSRARRDIKPLLGPDGLLTIQGMLQKIKQGLIEELEAPTA